MRIKYEENASPDIAEAASRNAIVVLPLGCIEQHGPHLPVGCDYGRPIEAADRARKMHGALVLVLPTIPFGPAGEHVGFPGTISMLFETWSAVVVEVLGNLLRDGFRRIVVAKGCGGHMGIEGPVYQFYCQHKREVPDLDIRVFGDEAWHAMREVIDESDIDQPTEVHAGAVETSAIMASTPELVRMERVAKPDRQTEPRSGTWWVMEELSPTGATGDPTQYDAELGKRVGETMTQVFADFLGEMWRRQPAQLFGNENCPR